MREMVQSDFKPLCKMLKDEAVMYAYEHAFDDEEAREWLDRQRKTAILKRFLKSDISL